MLSERAALAELTDSKPSICVELRSGESTDEAERSATKVDEGSDSWFTDEDIIIIPLSNPAESLTPTPADIMETDDAEPDVIIEGIC